MTEHKKTIEKLRKHYSDVLHFHFLSGDFYDWPERENHHKLISNDQLFERCTLLQLHALDILTKRGAKVLLLPCNPTDHLAVQMSSMYIGIETDGYTHS